MFSAIDDIVKCINWMHNNIYSTRRKEQVSAHMINMLGYQSDKINVKLNE